MSKLGPYSAEITRSEPDGRTREGRILKSTRKALLDHLGGELQVTEFQRMLVERACKLQLRISLLDDKLLYGTFSEYDEKIYLAWSNSFVRTLRELGLNQASTKPASDPMARLHSHLSNKQDAAA